MLFSSNIPYYVGPVGSGSKTGWAKIQESGQVLPWNMEQKIDIEQTSERFITNLIRECTYLSGEKVLPKQSLLYESYCVLNEINNLRIHGKRIVPELKQDIYKEVFQGFRLGKKVTKKNICTYLINRGLITEESEVSGIDKEINAYLPSLWKNVWRFWRTSERRSSSRDSRKNYLLQNYLWGCQVDVPKKTESVCF